VGKNYKTAVLEAQNARWWALRKTWKKKWGSRKPNSSRGKGNPLQGAGDGTCKKLADVNLKQKGDEKGRGRGQINQHGGEGFLEKKGMYLQAMSE